LEERVGDRLLEAGHLVLVERLDLRQPLRLLALLLLQPREPRVGAVATGNLSEKI